MLSSEGVERTSLAMVHTFLDGAEEPWPFALTDATDANLVARTLAGMAANLYGRADDSPETLLGSQLAALAMVDAYRRRDAKAITGLMPHSRTEAHQVLSSLAGLACDFLLRAYPSDEERTVAIEQWRERLLTYGARYDDTEGDDQ